MCTVSFNLYSNKQQYPNMLPSWSWNLPRLKLIMPGTGHQICCAWSHTNQAHSLPPFVGLLLPCARFFPICYYTGASPIALPSCSNLPPHSSTAIDDSFGFWGKQGSQSPELQRTRGDQATSWLRQSAVPTGSKEQGRKMIRGLVSDLRVPSGPNSVVLS